MAYRDTVTVCVFFFVFSLNIAALSVIEFAVSESKESQSKELVLNLDHSNFSDTVSKHNLVVVEFYAPWCGPCKKLAPEYEKAASILSSEDPPVILAKVDASNERNKGLATEFEIKGFPTIKILRNGGKNVQDYKGPRDADGIVAYLKKQSGPASTEIKSVEDASRLIDGNKIVVVGVFPEFSGEKFENFTALAEKLRSDYEFGHTLDDKLLPRGESTMSGPTVRLFKPFDKNSADFQDFNVDALENFVEEASVPTVTLFTKDPSSHPCMIKFFNNPNAKAMLFLNFSGDLVDAFESKYHDVAEQHKGQGISFLMGDLEASQNAFQYFGIEKDKAPLIIIQTNDGKKYVKPYLEPDQIASWVKEYKEGNVRPYKRSEPIPKVNNEPVKVVVADSLEDTVFNSGKNVFLELYAPWSDYCRKFTPTLDEVAVSFQSDADVIIAKIDFTANEIPKDIFKANGHPTLYFRSASGNLLPYKGNRTKEDIIDFIQKNRDKTAQKDSRKDDSLKDDM